MIKFVLYVWLMASGETFSIPFDKYEDCTIAMGTMIETVPSVAICRRVEYI